MRLGRMGVLFLVMVLLISQRVSLAAALTSADEGVSAVESVSLGGREFGEKKSVKVRKITLNKKGTVELAVGKALTLKAKVTPSVAGSKVTWKSSKKSVATVSKGKVTAKKVGTTTITATAGGKKATVELKVVVPAAKSVALNKSGTQVLEVKGKLKLKATVSPEAASQKVKWSSSKTGVATISEGGQVVAVKVGTATITAKTANGKKATVKVKVIDRDKLYSITLNKSSTQKLDLKKALTLKYTVLPKTVATKAKVTWTTSNKRIASVSKGKVTAEGVGTATITATAKLGGKTVTDKVKVKVTDPAADDNAAIAAAKELVEGARYESAAQAKVNSAPAAKAHVEQIIGRLSLNGVKAVVDGGSFHAAEAGTAKKPDGVNGVYGFTVKLTRGKGTQQTTKALTLTIEATKYDASDDVILAAAKGIVEGAAYGFVQQSSVNSADGAKAHVEGILRKLPLNGATPRIHQVDFKAAEAGTAAKPDGADGAYSFTVELTKGSAEAQTTGRLTLTIAADKYDSTPDDNAAIGAAKAAVEGVGYGSVSQLSVNSAGKAKAHVEGLIGKQPLNGVKAVVNEQSFKAAEAGTVSKPNGVNGAYVFTVSLSRGKGGMQTTRLMSLTIAAAAYDSTADDNAAIGAAKSVTDADIYGSMGEFDGNTEADARAHVERVIQGLNLSGAKATINPVSFKAPKPGTSAEPSGEMGAYVFTITLSKGKGSAQTTSERTLPIATTKYDSSKDDGLDITAARSIINETSFIGVDQVDAPSEAAAKAHAQGILSGLPLNGVKATVDTVLFDAAEPGTRDDKAGINGQYSFVVVLTKGKGMPQTSEERAFEIIATAYDSTEDDSAAINRALQLVESAEYGPVDQADIASEAAAKAYVERTIEGLDMEGVNATVNKVWFTPPVAGVKGTESGADGVYRFTVSLEKDKGVPKESAERVLMITATAYDSTEDDNAAIVAAKGLVESADYGLVAQGVANTRELMKARVEDIIGRLDLDGVTATVCDEEFAPATAGVIGNVSGSDGTYRFKVELTRDKGMAQKTDALTVVITATAYDSTADDNAAIVAAKGLVESAAYGPYDQSGVTTLDLAKAEIVNVIQRLELNGVTATICDEEFQAATAGGSDTPNGKNGFYRFKVALSRGKGEPRKTNLLTAEITATVYDPRLENDLAITAAYTTLQNTTFGPVAQASAETGEEMMALVAVWLNGLDLGGVAATIVEEETYFEKAVAGTSDNPGGSAGFCEFTVALSKGNGGRQTITLSVVITATVYGE